MNLNFDVNHSANDKLNVDKSVDVMRKHNKDSKPAKPFTHTKQIVLLPWSIKAIGCVKSLVIFDEFGQVAIITTPRPRRLAFLSGIFLSKQQLSWVRAWKEVRRFHFTLKRFVHTHSQKHDSEENFKKH